MQDIFDFLFLSFFIFIISKELKQKTEHKKAENHST